MTILKKFLLFQLKKKKLPELDIMQQFWKPIQTEELLFYCKYREINDKIYQNFSLYFWCIKYIKVLFIYYLLLLKTEDWSSCC